MNPKETTLPSLADDPQYTAATAKLVELQVDLNMLETRSSALLIELNSIASHSSRGGDAVDAAARRLLGIDTGTSPHGRASEVREALAEVFEKKQVLIAAIRIQREELAKLRQEVSRTCIAKVLPAHRELVRNIVDCLRALDLAQQAEHELRDGLFSRDIALGELRAMPISKLGRLADHNSRVSAYFLECYEQGFIALDEVPKHLRELALAKTAKPAQQAKAVTVAADPADWRSL